MAKKLLIIKLGYTETLDSSLSLTTSLGDVLRTTFILHFFKDYQISWLVDESAVPLLEGNKRIDNILVYNSNMLNDLKKENFDVIINLEKLPEICLFANYLKAKTYFGFGLDGSGDKIVTYHPKGETLVKISQDVNERKKNEECWQKLLAESLDRAWNGEEYVLGYVPKTKISYDIGFNWATSKKWTNKAWPKSYWEELESLLKDKYSISWQQGINSLYDYIDWINSCRLIITSDSLGLHLCLAIKKPVISLFGPTSPNEVYFYDCGSYVLPESPYDCIPCLKPVCDKEKKCIEYISPQRLKEKIEDELKKCKPAPKV